MRVHGYCRPRLNIIMTLIFFSTITQNNVCLSRNYSSIAKLQYYLLRWFTFIRYSLQNKRTDTRLLSYDADILEELLNQLSSLKKSMKFTIEQKVENSIQFSGWTFQVKMNIASIVKICMCNLIWLKHNNHLITL